MSNGISFNDETERGKYSREISYLLENSGMREWFASANVKKPEIFIRPKNDPEWQNFHAVSRISLQLNENNELCFGVSGYNPTRIRESRKIYESKGYKYHDKGFTKDGRPLGRWWLTKNLSDLDSIAYELKDIQGLLYNKD